MFKRPRRVSIPLPPVRQTGALPIELRSQSYLGQAPSAGTPVPVREPTVSQWERPSITTSRIKRRTTCALGFRTVPADLIRAGDRGRTGTNVLLPLHYARIMFGGGKGSVHWLPPLVMCIAEMLHGAHCPVRYATPVISCAPRSTLIAVAIPERVRVLETPPTVWRTVVLTVKHYTRIVPVSPRCHSFNSVTALNVSSAPKLPAPIGYG